MSNLPPGVTEKMVSGGNVDEEECDNCGGRGRVGSECCCAPVPEETGCCVRCGEHATDEECPECDGTGYVQVDLDEKRREAQEEAACRRGEERELWND